MRPVKFLTEQDVAMYYSSPLECLRTWRNQHDILKVADRHIFLCSADFKLIRDSKVIAGGRNTSLEAKLPVNNWPMYLDGKKHEISKNRYISDILTIKNSLDHCLNDCIVRDISRKNLVSIILQIYSTALSVNHRLLKENYKNMSAMHKCVLSRNPIEAQKYWTAIYKSMDTEAYKLSSLCFIVADTIPSILHTFYSCMQRILRENVSIKVQLTASDIMKALKYNPPFYNIVRVALYDITPYRGYLIKSHEKIVFPIRLWCLDNESKGKYTKYIFGDGVHACPGKGLVIQMLQKLLGLLDINGKNQYKFKTKDDGNVYFIEDAFLL